MSSDLNASELAEIAVADQPDRPDRRRGGRLVANRAFGALKAQHNAERGLLARRRPPIDQPVRRVDTVPAGAPRWFAVWIPWNLGWLGFRHSIRSRSAC